MKQILFATGNSRKFKEAQDGCALCGIEVVQVKLEIDEIQSHDPKIISLDKANKAYLQTKAPVTVSDTSWRIPALNGFPGGYMKDVASWLTSQDFLNLMIDKEDRQVFFIESIIYQDAEQQKVFSREYEGVLTKSPRGNGNSIERIAEFGGLTIAEKHDKGEMSHKPEDYVWYEFAKWFSNKN